MGTIYHDIDSFSGSNFTEKLQNAVNQCVDATGGKSMILVIPEGNYTVASPISVGSSNNTVPFTIMGQPSGPGTGTSRIYAPYGFIKNYNTTSAACFTIENITIYGNGSYNCIDIEGKWMKLRNLSISGFSKGIKIGGSYNLIENVEINSCSCGIEITPIGATIQNCHIHSCTNYGIKTLRGNLTDPSNSLNIIGLIAESNGTSSTGAQIEINETDYVSITNSYIGDNATTAIKNNGGTHVQIDNMLQSIGGPHRIIHQTSGSMKCCGYYYCPDNSLNGIKIEDGTVDFSDMKTYLAYSFIENSSGRIIMPESRFQSGYNLSGSGNGTTKPTSFYGELHSSGTNFMGITQYQLWSKYNNSNLNVYIPGICYNFTFPEYLRYKVVYLHIGFDYIVNDTSVDVFFNGGQLDQPISNFLANSFNVVSNTRIRLLAAYKYFNIPIKLNNSTGTLQVTIAAPLLQNLTRNNVATISFIYANDDNRFNIPLPWVAQ